MIHIGTPKLANDLVKGISTISIIVTISGEEHKVWYSFPSKFKDYASLEVADSLVVAFLWYAMEHSIDIETELPVSEKLMQSLTKELIPFFDKYFPYMHSIKLHCNLFMDDFHGTHVGTGISCGIDSLSTIIYHGLQEEIQHYKVDTLTLLNSGYYSNNLSYMEYTVQSRNFAEEHGYSFLSVDSNLSNITNYDFMKSHTFLTNSIILLFQKYFKNYFYASGFPVSQFNVNYKNHSAAKIELYSLKNISTQSLTFHSGCNTFTRVEKTKLIMQYPDFRKYLFVCTSGRFVSENCSECEKCIRTMLALESIGMADKIGERFDEKIYQKNRIRYISFALRKRNKNIFYKEIIDSFKQNNIKIPLRAHLCIMPCKFEINNFKSKLVSTKLGGYLYKKLKR